ncbi:GH1 family beta-glucosidase [Gracilinema caldarium]|uniref:GH1 family beta-glucosidase n=1 Tax=Gracilinema caldarium TaxID=215591 RepID=UPI0026EF714D|nr:GH1 family beta-glucosidase [Gracilinema caldarium]
MAQLVFPQDFLWGTATASFQVEGAAYEDGRGESIWDRFCRIPGKVFAGDNGDVACDQYHRYPEDIKLMKEAGIQAYRFSIAWPRIYPTGTGEPNPRGIAYYRALATALREAGIEPVATLYHWDLPQALQDRGGWENRETAVAFETYARTCFTELGDLIHTWITLNEPWCSAYLGYGMGHHAPGIADKQAEGRAVHHLNLAHGLAVRAFRESGKPGKIGITWNIMVYRPATRNEKDLLAAELATDRDSRMFTGPVCGYGYPQRFIEHSGVKIPVQPGDLDLIAAPIDFAGLNYYSEHAVAWDDTAEEHIRWVPSWQEKTDMGWPIVPQGFVRHLRWLSAETGGIPIYVTENGCAQKDEVQIDENGQKRVHDMGRIDYLRSHFQAMSQALDEGVPLKGYFLWSLLDNFEWAHGYSKRFGIIYMDYSTLQRIPKDSYYYYRDVIAGYGE